MRTQTIKFGEFLKSEGVISKEKEANKVMRKKEIKKLVIRVSIATLIISHPHISLPAGTVYAAGKTVEIAAAVAVEPGKAWENLINKLLDLLDPIAKIFGMIAGIAIMTGNGKIGLERLFWLSVGYITTRKVDAWIGFLNSI